MTNLKRTFLTDIHKDLGAKLTPFSGYNMPLQYTSMIDEHNWVRQNAGLFDISHMGVIRLEGPKAQSIIETLCPVNLSNLQHGQCKYSFILNTSGGIEDDIIITKEAEDSFIIVINAGCKEADIALFKAQILDGQTQLTYFEDAPLIALQGPKAVKAFEDLYLLDLSDLKFMQAKHITLNGKAAFVSRTGYTGEDGLEIALLHHATLDDITQIWQQLLSLPEVKPIGLGARDSLRLEAGLALYGQDLTQKTTPIEATLSWALDTTNTTYNGQKTIEEQRENGTKTKRCGLLLTDKGILRHGYKVFNQKEEEVGEITSGGFCPSNGKSIAQAYIKTEFLTDDHFLVEVRGKMLKAEKHPLRFYNRS